MAVVLLWWVLRGTDAEALTAQFRRASVWGLLVAAALNFSQNFFRVWRWRALLEPVRARIPFRPLFAAVILGYLVSWVIPGRLGELVRPALLSGREGVPLAPCLGSVVADRVLDAVTILFLFAIGMWITPLQGQAAEYAASIRVAALIMVAGLCVVLGLLVAAGSARATTERWIEARRGPLRWLGRVLLAFSRGTDALKQPRLFFAVVLHSLLVWSLIAAGLWLGVRSCGAAIPFGGILIMTPIVAAGVALPTPGGAGGFHAAMTFGLAELFGVEPSVAVGAGILVHLMVFIPIIVLGPALIALDRIPMNDLLRAARQVRGLGGTANAVVVDGRPAEDSP